MLVLGIDPGTAICGYGFVEAARGSRLIAHEYGAITTSPKANMQDRLVKLYDELDALIKKYNISSGQLDRLRKNENVNTHTLNMLCTILNCKLSDIAEFKADE